MSPRPQFPNEREDYVEERGISPIVPEIVAVVLLVVTASVVFFVSFAPAPQEEPTGEGSQRSSSVLTEAERRAIEVRLAQSATSTLSEEERAEIQTQLRGNSEATLSEEERRAIEQQLSE